MKRNLARCSTLLFYLVMLSALKTANARQNSRKVVCYLGSWANYRHGEGKFVIEDINPHLCTHLVYAFAKLENNQITPYDPYLDLKTNYGLGGYERFVALKKINPEVKTLIAIGGWNEGSSKYSQMARDPNSRRTFVNSVVDFLNKYHFDGLDVDWEYPANRGGVPEDKSNFVLLLQELQAALRPRGLLLSAAVSAGKSTIDSAYDIRAIQNSLDYINLMAYDFHGGWDTVTGHNAPLYQRSSEDKTLNVDFAVKYWLDHGTPREKLILGMPLYGRTFALNDPNVNGVGAPATKGMSGKYTGEAGFLGYYEVCELFQSQPSWTKVFDKVQMVPYAHLNRDWISYDDVNSISIKMDYVLQMGLGGGMVWSIETDDFRGKCGGKYPLLQTINKGLNRKVPDIEMAKTTPHSNPPTKKASPSAKPINPKPTSSEGRCKTTGYLRDPEDCKKFYHCVDNGSGDISEYKFDCAPGTVFSEKIFTCTFPDQVPECQ